MKITPVDYWCQDYNTEQIKNVMIFNLATAFKGSKYPKSVNTSILKSDYTTTIKNLGSSPIGSGHDNFLHGILVSFDLTFSIKAWTEAERYHFLEFTSSQSTMHRVTKFDFDNQCIEYVDQRIIDICKEKVKAYNDNQTPENYLYCLYNIPVGLKLTASMTTNYQQLKNIYGQRKLHRLPEWREVCKWIETLPYMDDFLKLEEKENE